MTLLVLALLSSGISLFAMGIVMPVYVRPRPPSRPSRARPPVGSISVIVPAYLEASVVKQKISETQRDLHESGVPGEVIVVASDAATASAASDANIVLFGERQGKPAAINQGVAAASSDVCVLTDANCSIGPSDWPKKLLDGLASWDLVSAPKQESGGSEKLFWWLESLYKRRASTAGTLAVAGEFMAFRKSNFRAVPTASLCDDLWQALDFHRRGLTVSVLPDLYTTEPPATPRDQWGRRTRIAQGLFLEAFPALKDLMSTSDGRAYVAHKVYRSTIGCIGFWLALLGLVLALSTWAAVVFVGILCALLGAYTGRIPAPRSVRAVAGIVGLQAVPVVAAARIAMRPRRREPSAGWEKIPR